MADRRFEGALTTATDSGEVPDASIVPAPERPRRPVIIELASAILIVGGITSILGAAGWAISGGQTGPVGVLVMLLDILTIVVGVLIRSGRAWVVAINVVAIALFLELTALPSAFAIVFVVLDSIVLYALFRHRTWFDRRAPEEVA